MQVDMKGQRGVRRSVDDISSRTREPRDLGRGVGLEGLRHVSPVRVNQALSEQNPHLAESMDDSVGQALGFPVRQRQRA